MARLLALLTLAALETTVVSLPLLALTSFRLPWAFLLLLVFLGLLADAVSLRVPRPAERPVLAAGAAVAALLMVSGQTGGGMGAAYVLVLVALYLYWRGTRLGSGDSAVVSTLFGRGSAAILVSLLIGPVLGIGAPLSSGPVLAQVVGFVSLGLLALALSHAEDDPATRAQRLGWRWLLTLALAIGAVVLAGVLAIALLGGGTEAAQNLLRIILLPFALIGGLIAYLIVVFLAAPLAYVLRQIMARMNEIQQIAPPPEQATPDQASQGMFEAIYGLANGATFLMALIPIAVLVAVILFLRGRRRRPKADDEERESLGVASSLASDLRDLLGRVRNPFARHLEGLQAALEALRGNDPATRVRRAYVRFLLRLEEHERPRGPAETPAELAVAVAEAPHATAALTDAYEQARYNPAGVPPARADAAEAALDSIGRAEPKRRGA